jgi:hypothetical protein
MARDVQIADPVHVEREPVTEAELERLGVHLRDFPGSTASDFARYPVLSEGGWFVVVKHVPTLRTVSREPWHLFGPVELTSTGIVLE